MANLTMDKDVISQAAAGLNPLHVDPEIKVRATRLPPEHACSMRSARALLRRTVPAWAPGAV